MIEMYSEEGWVTIWEERKYLGRDISMYADMQGLHELEVAINGLIVSGLRPAGSRPTYVSPGGEAKRTRIM